jgi:hypothetical protein
MYIVCCHANEVFAGHDGVFAIVVVTFPSNRPVSAVSSTPQGLGQPSDTIR